jgi:hypothetical protein
VQTDDIKCDRRAHERIAKLEEQVTAASFGIAYAKLLDALHTQMPSLKVYAQSPIVRTNFVSAVADFRAQIVTACTGRAWVQYVNGLTILDAADLMDNAHPSNAGQIKYATKVLEVLP